MKKKIAKPTRKMMSPQINSFLHIPAHVSTPKILDHLEYLAVEIHHRP